VELDNDPRIRTGEKHRSAQTFTVKHEFYRLDNKKQHI